MEQKIIEIDKYFCKLTDLIPPKIYFDSNDEIKEIMDLEKKVKFADEHISDKAKHKKAKMDPTLNKTVTQIAREYDEEKEEKKNKKSLLFGSSKVELLRQKLQERIHELKSKRGGKRHKHEKKAQRESKDERKKQNRNQPGAKQKGFVKIKAIEANEKKSVKKEKSKADNNNNNDNDNDNDVLVQENLPKIYNDSGNLVFSKFDFVESSPSNKSQHRSKTKLLRDKLKEIKKDQSKLKQLEKKDSDVARKFKKNKIWKTALEKSEGIKVKDNPHLIEKSLKRREKLKKQSQKKWKERNDALETKMKKRQEKRQKNIKMRRDNKKEKKLSKLKKKGKMIPNKS